jgi:hypothetical protein
LRSIRRRRECLWWKIRVWQHLSRILCKDVP